MPKQEKKTGYTKVAESLYRYEPSGVYYARFRIGGKEVGRFSLGTKNLAEAKRLRDEEKRRLKRIDPDATDITVGGLLTKYLTALERYDAKTIRTRKSIAGIFERTFKPGLGILVHRVKPSMLDEWLALHRSRLRKVTLNEYMRFLRHLFEIAVKDRALTESPAAHLKQVRPERPIRTTPSIEEFEALVKNIREEPNSHRADYSADFVEFLGRAGVGTAEAAGLRWRAVDWKSGRITLYRYKTDTGFTIPIFPQVVSLLESIHDRRTDRSPNAKVFHIASPKKAITNACKRLGFPHYTPRSFRRMFITRCIERGIDFKTIAAWQGHRDGGILIASTYSHLRTEHADEMAKRLS